MRLFLEEGAKRPLTAPPAFESDGLPVLSPGGRSIAFTRRQLNTGSVCLLAVDSGRVQCLYGAGAPGGTAGQIGGIAWEADGKGLLYYDKSAMWRMALDGDRVQRVTQVMEGVFTDLTGDRQGRRLAFSKISSDFNIWRTTRDGKRSQKLIASNEEDSEPAFSPNGRQILFRSRRTGSFEIFVGDDDGAHTRQLTRFAGHLGSARWSPDSQWIAFDGYGSASEESAKYTNIYAISAAGGPLRRVHSGFGRQHCTGMVARWTVDLLFAVRWKPAGNLEGAVRGRGACAGGEIRHVRYDRIARRPIPLLHE